MLPVELQIHEPWAMSNLRFRGDIVCPLVRGYYLLRSWDSDLYVLSPRYTGDTIEAVFHGKTVIVSIARLLDNSLLVMQELLAGRIEELLRESKIEYFGIGSLKSLGH